MLWSAINLILSPIPLFVPLDRLAFKLAYDQIVLGEGDEDEDLITNLEDYESNWYLGSDTDEEWKEAIKRQKPELFSLMFNPQEVRDKVCLKIVAFTSCQSLQIGRRGQEGRGDERRRRQGKRG